MLVETSSRGTGSIVRAFLWIAFACILVANALAITSLLGKYWQRDITLFGVKSHSGLFEVCLQGQGCAKLSSPSSLVLFVRWALALGVCFNFASLVALCVVIKKARYVESEAAGHNFHGPSAHLPKGPLTVVLTLMLAAAMFLTLGPTSHSLRRYVS